MNNNQTIDHFRFPIIDEGAKMNKTAIPVDYQYSKKETQVIQNFLSHYYKSTLAKLVPYFLRII